MIVFLVSKIQAFADLHAEIFGSTSRSVFSRKDEKYGMHDLVSIAELCVTVIHLGSDRSGWMMSATKISSYIKTSTKILKLARFTEEER